MEYRFIYTPFCFPRLHNSSLIPEIHFLFSPLNLPTPSCPLNAAVTLPPTTNLLYSVSDSLLPLPTHSYIQLHSADVGDGYDWGRLNLRSVTEESRLDDFLHTAELAGTEFTAGRCSVAQCVQAVL